MIAQRNIGRLVISLAVLILIGMIAAPVGSSPAPESVNQTSVNIEEKLGIKIVGLRLTAAGHMLDFRYKVIDPKKAEYMLSRKNKAHLIDQTTNKVFGVKDVPKIGQLRQGSPTPEAGRVYFMIFSNSGMIQAKSKVTLVVGDFRIENLTVGG
jgi:hypothetical protein